MDEQAAMRRAIELGEQGRCSAPPNPWVGCVLLSNGEVVGEGFHEQPGSPHAEPAALAEAGDRARGATAVVTLEPCSHEGRTPPCADALVEAGVARVVVGVRDPDPRVSGTGIDRLRQAGIAVEVADDPSARRSLRSYLHHRSTGRAFCLLKVAVSLDGRTAAADGSSRWITGEAARTDAHRLRAESQAVVVGSGTALADRPALTVRHVEAARQPLRVLLDGRGRVPAEGPLFDDDAPTLVVTTAAADADAVRAWKAAGAAVEEVAAVETGIDVAEVAALLGRLGVVQALVEGGASVLAAFVRAGMADALVTYVGGVVLGDDGRAVFEHLHVPTIDAGPRWRLGAVAVHGDDVRIDWERA